MSKVEEYWDTLGGMQAEDDPEEEYKVYLAAYPHAKDPLTLDDFIEYIEELKERKAIGDEICRQIREAFPSKI